ncbi:hypothetical protein [uncultured Maricaulis sp.]|uniref:hypothetical protein n=1 Tax=uncultured Maricaulis sp. TaxID=174710 RepID=UPI0030D9D6E7|tara:strand:- start:37333 stop:37761 length:429 start_codon:yes stop_codon:yes gene_type:complete
MSAPTTPLAVHSHGHAIVVANALHAAGIPATIVSSNFDSAYPGVDQGTTRPRILVPPAHEAEARAIIALAQTVANEPLYPCPHCGGETTVKTRPLLSALRLVLSGQFSQVFSQPRYCGACDHYESPRSEPFTAEELGYPPIR